MSDPTVTAVLDTHAHLASACGRPAGWRGARPRGLSLSRRQAAILRHLEPRKQLPIGDLARRLRITPATMSLAVDRLVALGCIKRFRDSTDRRRVLLGLTATGIAARAAFHELDPVRVATLLERLSPADRAATLLACKALSQAALDDKEGAN